MNVRGRKEDGAVVLAWLLLAAVVLVVAVPTIRDAGLDYDESVYGHLTRDFLTGRQCEQHMPGSVTVELGGRPFPWFVQGYLGAVKCWMLTPSFFFCGATVGVMRATMLGWGLLGVLFLMLFARRALGLAAAVLTGWLLALDPAFFFPTICEWGAFVPGFVCRCAGLFFAAVWWKRRQARWLVLVGVSFGLGFFNKIDFIVFLLALAGALLAVWARELWRSWHAQGRQWLAGVVAFLVTASPMLVNCLHWFRTLWEVQAGPRAGESATKLKIAMAALDGSYFLRLMEAGGLFERMFESPASVSSPLGLALGLAVLVLAGKAIRDAPAKRHGVALFLLAGLGLSVVGFGLLPDALRIHHFLLIYPFPQLVLAAAITEACRARPVNSLMRQTARAAATLCVVAVLAGHIVAVIRTQRFVAATGGRGMWSLALMQFAEEVRTREDLVIASLDWGFHEQLSFLTAGPKLYELTWNLQQGLPVSLVRATNHVYLVHPPEMSLFPFGESYLEAARRADPGLIIESRTNQEGRVVFQAFRFSRP